MMLETLRNNKLLSALLLALAAALTAFTAQFWGTGAPVEVTPPAPESPVDTVPETSVTELPTSDVSTDVTATPESSAVTTPVTTVTETSQQP